MTPTNATAIAATLILSACVAAPDPHSLDWDPFEDQNRAAHEVNVPVDRAVYGPVARAYGTAVPQPSRLLWLISSIGYLGNEGNPKNPSKENTDSHLDSENVEVKTKVHDLWMIEPHCELAHFSLSFLLHSQQECINKTAL